MMKDSIKWIITDRKKWHGLDLPDEEEWKRTSGIAGNGDIYIQVGIFGHEHLPRYIAQYLDGHFLYHNGHLLIESKRFKKIQFTNGKLIEEMEKEIESLASIA